MRLPCYLYPLTGSHTKNQLYICPMNKVYLLLGSNIGKREIYLSEAIKIISEKIGKVVAQSSVYTTEPWGNVDQNDFLNEAICIKTKLAAKELLDKILGIEKQLGRSRIHNSESGINRWKPRKIDIDILFFNDEIIDDENLIVPHPHLHKRRFALVPLNEIAKEFIHPVFKKTISELISTCFDILDVKKHKPTEQNRCNLLCILVKFQES